MGAPLPHPKGTIFEFVTEVHADGELVWESTSTYLRRGRGDENASGGSVTCESAEIAMKRGSFCGGEVRQSRSLAMSSY